MPATASSRVAYEVRSGSACGALKILNLLAIDLRLALDDEDVDDAGEQIPRVAPDVDVAGERFPLSIPLGEGDARERARPQINPADIRRALPTLRECLLVIEPGTDGHAG